MKESTLYFFYTIGCGWCTKAEPIIEELNAEGHDILRLDLAEPDNKSIAEDLKQKHNIKCGTPLFIDAGTGHHVCGYREKDTMLKWLAGEDIPPPPKPTRPAPRVPFHDARPNETNNWKVDYDEWVDENSHLPNLKTADELLAMPRPKYMPPQMPRPGSADTVIKKWRTGYKKWAKENRHLPNIMPVDQLEQRIRNAPQPQQQVQNANPAFEYRLRSVESKLDKLMAHLGVK